MTRQSQLFKIRASGPLACFTRPEMKVERVSYPVMTPSAARGVLESILWKPAIAWEVRSITLLAPIRWASFVRNEVKSRLSPRRQEPYYASEDRTQRNTVALRDVDYVIEARFSMTALAGPQDGVVKFEEMFRRRLEAGQHFSAPYLGCREFAARVEPAPEPAGAAAELAGVDMPLGMVFLDFDYGSARPVPRFFEARLQNGVVRVPPRGAL